MDNTVLGPEGAQVPVRHWRAADGLVHAEAPDLPGCAVAGPRLEEVLPMLRLAVEGRITAWAEIHIHTGHLAALVRHQAR
jgi:predicted RNase H-like HicB family nuclease